MVDRLHEYSITRQIIETVLDEAEKHKAKKVLEVKLIIGKLTVLGIEQIKFCYELLTEKTIMEDSRLTIVEENPVVECENCDYKGRIHFDSEHVYHFIPTLACPRCIELVKVINGKEVLVSSIEMVVKSACE